MRIQATSPGNIGAKLGTWAGCLHPNMEHGVMNSANYNTTANLSINASSSSVFTATLCCMSNTSSSDRAPMPSLCDDAVTRHNTRVTTMGRSTAAGKFDIQIYFSGELQLYVECSHSLFMSILCKSRRC